MLPPLKNRMLITAIISTGICQSSRLRRVFLKCRTEILRMFQIKKSPAFLRIKLYLKKQG
ncbi:hypothetical protein lpa_04103 [Legionella pneumophila 2300/99 Alcoy]|nr:hypothetical protein lpa_04103 [Legionella pneumophila 2300/99 Alcoy]